uniref:Uncharacterized protein n=1 Tax=Arundo donax TaxID=35708 RepID=A0A0A8YNQ8_ARUDO
MEKFKRKKKTLLELWLYPNIFDDILLLDELILSSFLPPLYEKNEMPMWLLFYNPC